MQTQLSVESSGIHGSNLYKLFRFTQQNIDKISGGDLYKKNIIQNQSSQVIFDVDVINDVDQSYANISDIYNLYNSRIRNHILIKNGEIPFNYKTGSGIYESMYEQSISSNISQQLNEQDVGTLSQNQIKEKIKSNIIKKIEEQFKSEIIIKSVQVEEILDDSDSNRELYQINIQYNLIGVGDNHLILSLERQQNIQ